MKRDPNPCLLTLLLAAVLACWAPDAVQSAEDVVACPSGSVNLGIAYGDIVNCSIEEIGNSDKFRFFGTQGEVVRIQITGLPGGSPQFQLFDPNGDSVVRPTGSPLTVELKDTGVHVILVSEFGNDQTVEYALILERIAPPSPTARQLPINTTHTDEIDPVLDLDPLIFDAEKGDALVLSIARLSGGFPQIELFDPDADLMVGPTGSTFTRIAPKTGLYTILVSEFGNDHTTEYAVHLQCSGCSPLSKLGTHERLGGVRVGHNWKNVKFKALGSRAVVIVGPPTFNSPDPGVVRVRGVSATGFQLSFREWDYRSRNHGDNSHRLEGVSYLAIEAGRYRGSDGSIWEAGTFKLGGNRTWKRVKFDGVFPTRPYLFLTVQTERDGEVVVARARKVTQSGFQSNLFEEEFLKDGHRDEIVGYLAIVAPAGSKNLRIAGQTLPYMPHQVRVNHGFRTVIGSQVKLEEEQSQDQETNHSMQIVHVLGLGDQLFAQDISGTDPDTAALRRRTPSSAK